jgi:hypothetical protein
MKTIAYLTPYHTRDSFQDTDMIIEDFSDVSYEILAELFR